MIPLRRYISVKKITDFYDDLRGRMGHMDDDTPSLPCAEKLAFDTPKQAQAAATVALYQHGTKLRIYHCRHCRLWHLSSA
jgi:hypothetical protein